MRFRQVHLDFHTSEHIPGIGAQFDKKQFQQALIDGHVDSITVFSKCHHGWAYHPSRANRMHPGLNFDLLGAQLEACKEINVKAPVYISAGLDEKEALLHPEWLRFDFGAEHKNYSGQPHWHAMCYNTPYLDALAAQVEEVMERYDPCGIFLDISAVRKCVCPACCRSMLEKGLDPNNEADVLKHGEEVYANYCLRMEQAVRKYSATATIFHNAGHISHGRRDIAGYNTHLELESLPTGGWGYDHFPMSSAYVRTLDTPFLGMTGKFHTTWGEFGGFKHPNALIYETGLSLACGARCSIGDQMHPGGEMNMSTYKLIGAAYAEVEKKEKWCEGAKNIADIAVLSCEAILGTGRNGFGTESNTGANRILLEGKHLFDFIDEETAFENYKLVILPDHILLCDQLTARLENYIAQGGKVLMTGWSGLDMDMKKFMIDPGAQYAGVNEFKPDYMIPSFPCTNGETAYIMYAQGQKLANVTGKVFAHRQTPYFNRAPFRFCSHQHTPNDVSAPLEPAAVCSGSVAYISWTVFEDYAQKGELICKELVLHAIEMLLSNERTVRVSLPDRGVVTVTEQGEKNIVHLLFAHTTVRGKNIEVIEDAVPLHDVAVSLRREKKPGSVALVPQMDNIPFNWDGERVSFTVPKVLLHQMVCVE